MYNLLKVQLRNVFLDENFYISIITIFILTYLFNTKVFFLESSELSKFSSQCLLLMATGYSVKLVQNDYSKKNIARMVSAGFGRNAVMWSCLILNYIVSIAFTIMWLLGCMASKNVLSGSELKSFMLILIFITIVHTTIICILCFYLHNKAITFLMIIILAVLWDTIFWAINSLGGINDIVLTLMSILPYGQLVMFIFNDTHDLLETMNLWVASDILFATIGIMFLRNKMKVNDFI